jgi:hypothetical protein
MTVSAAPCRAPARIVIGVLVLFVVGFAPGVAHADAAGPTDYASEIVAISPDTGLVDVSIEGGDAFVRVEVEPGHEVIVLGYAPDSEPYLRIGPDGTVEENARSYATYYNQERFGGSDIPAIVDNQAAPEWRRIGSGGAWSWHDHRAHWMGDEPPIGLEPGDALPDQTIDLLVDGAPVGVVVRTTLQAEPSPLPAIVGVLIGLQIGLLGFALGPATATMSVLVTALAATVVGAGQYLSLSAATGPLFTWWALPLIAAVSAAVTIAIYGRSELVQVGLLMLGGAMLLIWAVRRRDVLGAAVLPTDLPYWFDRMTTAAAAIVGLLALATAARALARLLTPPEPAAVD